ncbi:hypothetical protein QBC39DRAFT_419134 [Podospora conica]|nr:hypothetical protein QBC39DRAFT_419134 [Schizothecium conicum]
MLLGTYAHDKHTARARQVKAFWTRLDALEQADQTTPLQDECLQLFEQDRQLSTKLDVLLTRNLSTGETSLDAEPWPALWESNPNSLRAQLRWIRKWADQLDRELEQLRETSDDELGCPSPAALPIPTPRRSAQTTRPALHNISDDEPSYPFPTTPPTPTFRYGSKAQRRELERKLRQPHNISDDEPSYPSATALPTPVSQRASEKRKRDSRLLKLYNDLAHELGSSIPATTPTTRNITCRGDGQNKAKRPYTLYHMPDDQDDKLESPSPATSSAHTGDGERNKKRPRRFSDILDEEAKLLSPATQASPDIAHPCPDIAHSIKEEARDFDELYNISGRELGSPSPISTRPVATPRPAPRKQRDTPSPIPQLVPLPSTLPILTYQPVDPSSARPGLRYVLIESWLWGVETSSVVKAMMLVPGYWTGKDWERMEEDKKSVQNKGTGCMNLYLGAPRTPEHRDHHEEPPEHHDHQHKYQEPEPEPEHQEPHEPPEHHDHHNHHDHHDHHDHKPYEPHEPLEHYDHHDHQPYEPHEPPEHHDHYDHHEEPPEPQQPPEHHDHHDHHDHHEEPPEPQQPPEHHDHHDHYEEPQQPQEYHHHRRQLQ